MAAGTALSLAARSVCPKESSRLLDRYGTAHWKAVCPPGGSPTHAAGWIVYSSILESTPSADGQIHPAALKESVQPKQTLRLRVVAVTHGMHKAHVLAHHRAEKLPKRGSGRSASSAASGLGFNSARTTGVVVRCPYCALKSANGLPVSARLFTLQSRKRFNKTRTIRDYVERPHQGSILEPLPYRCLRYRFVLRLLGDEALESVQDAQVNLR